MGATVEQNLYFVSIVGKYEGWRSTYWKHRTYQVLGVDSDHALAKAKRKFREDFPDYDLFSVRWQSLNMEIIRELGLSDLNK